MPEREIDRKTLIGKIGTFFIVLGVFAIIIFIASDVTRNDKGHFLSVTQTYVVQAVQAIQTRDSGATQAAPNHLPTPTLGTPPVVADTGSEVTSLFFMTFCLGTTSIGVGWLMWRATTPPRKASGRFEALRKIQQHQREKREAAKKGKQEKKKK